LGIIAAREMSEVKIAKMSASSEKEEMEAQLHKAVSWITREGLKELVVKLPVTFPRWRRQGA
jgi:hypothetical protein